MPDSTISAQTVINSAGITVAGIYLGLPPALLLAGFCGALWSLSICAPMPPMRRVAVATISTFVAGYASPTIIAMVRSIPKWPEALTSDLISYPCAMLIGFLSHRVLGPALLRIASRKIDEITR
jgi:hypothetical protein